MLYRKRILAVLLALIFLSFFGMLGATASMFPENYDWRYRVISNLLSPRDNPAYYWMLACGMSVAALLLLPFAGYLRWYLKIASPRAALVSSGAFMAGILALICASLVVPQHAHSVLGIHRLHEFLARSSAGFIAIGMLCGCWCAWKGRGRRLFGARLFWTWSCLTLLPLVGLVSSEGIAAAHTIETGLDDAYSRCVAAFGVVALGFLGMDRRRGGVRVSLRGRLFNAAARNAVAAHSTR